MKRIAILVAAAVVAGGIAVPASSAAQQDVQGSSQGEAIINGIIDGLIGNRYRASERDAVRSCGWAAVDKAERDYRRYSSNRPFAYPNYRGYVRLVGITDVQRRDAGFRVRGLLDTARRGYRGGGRGDVEFRCNTDRRGRVQNVRLDQLWR